MRIGIVLASQRLTVRSLLVILFAWSAGCNAVVNFDDFVFHPDEGDKRDSGVEDSGASGTGGDKDAGSNPKEDAGPGEPDSGMPDQDSGGPDSGMPDQDSGPMMSCEKKTEDCTNDVDDDCDHLRDCKDPDCANDPACCVPNQIPETSCTGGIDNDCDGHIDCADSDCAASPSCCPNPVAEVGSAACSDGLDNDCDGLKDCQEVACAMQPFCCNATGDERTVGTCSDGMDNDCDGLKDCLDPDCRTTSVCCTPTAGTETNCTDNVDNDCDGLVDCRDLDCSAVPACSGCVKNPMGATTEVNCADGIDNDCDQDRDCRDPDCAGTLACCVSTGSENTSSACIDGTDNDCDGLKDCSDPDCMGQLSCCVAAPENTPSTCGDNIDNDCDGVKDCADPSCTNIGSCCSPTGSENNSTACSDGKDNDCDGKLDCSDPDCAGLSSCCAFMTTGGGATIQGGFTGCCVPDGMSDPAAPNDGKDNDCDGLRDIPVLSSAFPTQGLPSAADEVQLQFAPEIIPSATLSCRTHRLNDTTVGWGACPLNGSTIHPFDAIAAGKPENDGLWATDVRWDFQSGEHSDVYTFKYYVHHTLKGINHCPQPHSDMQWFMKAAERLATPDAGTFKLGVDTFLASPFIKVRYKIPTSSWPDWKLDGSSPDIKMPSLRRRFVLSPDGKYLLITRNYNSTRSGSCSAASIKVHNTQMMKGPRNNDRFITYQCRAIVLNRAGVGVCLNESAGGPVFPVYADSNEVFANALGWNKANKFMWRILMESKTDGPVNFTRKCEMMPCTYGGIFLPDRPAFPQ
jgi:hypothetical protein